jgi:predicted HTH transcriptional regulator
MVAMLPQELEKTIKQGEGQTVDFKESAILNEPFKVARLMVAFANNLHVMAKYGGRILIGVKNDGSLEGIKRKQGHEEHLMNIARDKCEPAISPEFEVVSLNNNDIYVLTIPKMTRYPHAVKLQDANAYYVRVGTTVRVATPEELQELFVATGRPTINQVVQRLRESVPAFPNAYRSILIAPEYLVKNMIQFDEEIESWLQSIYSRYDLTMGHSHPTQDGVVFKFDKGVPDYFAKVTNEGIIYYR